MEKRQKPATKFKKIPIKLILNTAETAFLRQSILMHLNRFDLHQFKKQQAKLLYH